MPFLHRLQNLVCPHCLSTTDQLVVFALAEREKKNRHDGGTHWAPTSLLRAFVSCATCKQPSLIGLTPKPSTGGRKVIADASVHERYLNRITTVDALYEGTTQKHRTYAITADTDGDLVLDLYTIAEWHPKSALQRPERDLIPATVNAAFDELEGVLSQPRFAIIACRRILEIATGAILEQPKERLADRIGQLQGAGYLTKPIADWARTLKNVLNGNTHEGDQPGPDLAAEVISLTRLLVELLHVYPARIERLRQH